jgi:hypothetical protein
MELNKKAFPFKILQVVKEPPKFVTPADPCAMTAKGGPRLELFYLAIVILTKITPVWYFNAV